MLVFEDLDSLITDENRSFFLNEVDGLEENDGLLLVRRKRSNCARPLTWLDWNYQSRGETRSGAVIPAIAFRPKVVGSS